MRRLLCAAAAAAVILVPSSAHAVGTGVGTVTVPVTGFFRPTVGVAGAGNCTSAGAVLTATVAGVAVPEIAATVSVSCKVLNQFGGVLLEADASSFFNANATARTALLLPDTPVTICATVTVDSSSWSASGGGCAAVV